MNAESLNRKLTAILSADAKGYSRLMGEDEVGTVQLLKEYREIMAQLIHQDRGRVVDSPGDNLLAKFGSVVDATGPVGLLEAESSWWAYYNCRYQTCSCLADEFRFQINENGSIILSGNVTPLYFGGQVLFSMLPAFLL